ncbi:ABC transporter ATP-binding protein [Viridibacillus sp. YIM B01967]|uniref:ABC transporter ATP-binding protein n=1 Tax=Viridibacillus soli TaxID=2798301 RepID=A0ABS1H9Y5_9BACL|nr:ABC transporter ATP-binding protein [Viridibacillus soli]MBK3496109.1 ABC transporter ATP-binding protein [Viridibacillus soli]
METIIEVSHLKKDFQNESAIRDVSFKIEKGEIFGFLGPSGSGKTTTIKILTAQLLASGGKVRIFNEDAKALKQPASRSRFGILTDNSGLYTRLSVEENLLLYSKLYNLPESSVKEALTFVNLYEERKKRISVLSKGMIQRVTLARAILHKPELLFLDEPTSALDPVNTKHIYEGLRKLNEMGTTIFLTTHDMAEAEILCDRIAFLDAGEIRAIGTPSQLKRQFGDDSLTVELTDGRKEVIGKGAEDAKQMFEWMQNNLVDRVMTNEPSLGDIFVQVTGRKLL